MQGKTLYLGINPENWPTKNFVHYPVIRTERLDVVQALPLWPQFTHVIFTSRSAVRHWWEVGVPFGKKKAIAIGEATADELRCRSVFPEVAPEPTQEGIIALLKTLDLKKAYLFLPRSKRARNLLPKYLERRKVPFFAIDLYDTVLQKPKPVPNLADFDEIVFTSPSTVEGFLQIFKTFPKHCKLIPIGPVTESTLTKMQSLRYH